MHWCRLVCLSQSECTSVFFFCLFHCTVCSLDAQHLTAALVAVEDLGLRLEQSSTEAVEELLFLPTLKQLMLDVVSDHVSPLSIVSPPPVAGVVVTRPWVQWVMLCLPCLHRSPSMISRQAIIPSRCPV